MSTFIDLVDLAAEALGGRVVAANDEFFAPMESLVKASQPEWREGVYTERGKWMDGWETRRRREPGHDWAIIRLGVSGVVHGIVIDTTHFTGNHPERASLDGAAFTGMPSVGQLTSAGAGWQPLLSESPLAGDSTNLFAIADAPAVTHVRLNIFPDGGVARLRVHGVVSAGERVRSGERVDLAGLEHGGLVVLCSDMFYGHRQNLVLPGRSTHMGNGWETKRRRVPGNEWTIVRLAARGVVERVELDTDHFKGNAPGACALESCDLAAHAEPDLGDSSIAWRDLVPRTALQPDARHYFASVDSAPATHVRLNIFPDGGVARLRLIGRATLP